MPTSLLHVFIGFTVLRDLLVQPLATEDMRNEGVVPRVSLCMLTLRHRLDAIQQLVSELSGVDLMLHIKVEVERPTSLDELHGIEEPPLG